MAKKKMRRKAIPETPTCNCALLCDDVIVSQATGKHTLSGIIGAIVVRELPTVLGGYVTYVRISNVYGNQTVEISLENARTGEAVFRFDVRLDQQEPLGVYTVVATIPAFAVEEAGRYVFQAASRGEPLAQSPIMIVQAGAASPRKKSEVGDGDDDPNR